GTPATSATSYAAGRCSPAAGFTRRAAGPRTAAAGGRHRERPECRVRARRHHGTGSVPAVVRTPQRRRRCSDVGGATRFRPARPAARPPSSPQAGHRHHLAYRAAAAMLLPAPEPTPAAQVPAYLLLLVPMAALAPALARRLRRVLQR